MGTSNSSNPTFMTVRQAVVEEALSWEGTRFHHAQCLKGVGVDCAMSLIAWFSRVGVIDWFDPRPYPASWFLHQSEERFLEMLAKYARPLAEDETPWPADVAMFKYGRCVAHGALIVDDTFVIHACSRAKRVERRERAALHYSLHSYWRVIGR